jgi:RHS repeat-associated protein
LVPVTKGSVPSLSVSVNPITNRLNGHGYDVNGNLTSMPNLTLAYDLENRLVQTVHSLNGTERYVCDPANQRVWKQEPSRTLVYFYGVEGNLLATYGDGVNSDYNVYFGAKLVWAEASPGIAAGPVTLDRLGSAVRHFPYGDEPSTTTQDRVKFATYYRDSTSTLDYARNRYYSRSIGRFTTPDPSGRSVRLADPQSWNRYSYVQNDPVNANDPSGLMMIQGCYDDRCWGGGGGGWSMGVYWWNGYEWEYPEFVPSPAQARYDIASNALDPLVGDVILSWGVGNNVATRFDVYLDADQYEALAVTGLLQGQVIVLVEQNADKIWKVAGLTLTALAAIYDWATSKRGSLVEELQRRCTPGRLVTEPSTTYKGGTSYEQEYICPEAVYSVHWIEKNGKVVHGPHIRPGAPKGGGGGD